MEFNFRGWSIFPIMWVQFSQTRALAHYVLYNQADFADLIFVVRRSSMKTGKIGPFENFPLYSI